METLEQLEDDYWGPAPTKTTPVIRRSFELRQKTLDQFTPSDIDHMISQRIGLEYLINRAAGTLFDNPLLEAWAYSGDLLLTVISVGPDFWQSHPDRDRLHRQPGREIYGRSARATRAIQAQLDLITQTAPLDAPTARHPGER